MSIYDPLRDYLANRVTIKMIFAKIEEVLKFELPKSAYKYTAWWGNETHGQDHNHAQLQAWEGAGWKVKEVVLGEYVIFHRAAYANLTR